MQQPGEQVAPLLVGAQEVAAAAERRQPQRHVAGNVAGPVFVYASTLFGVSIVFAAGLSFLGLGVQPPTPSWGSMIADGRDLYQLRHAPWTSLFPGLAIGAAVLGFNLLGDALRDALDPRSVRSSMPGKTEMAEAAQV